MIPKARPEILDELSKDTLKSYVKKAALDHSDWALGYSNAREDFAKSDAEYSAEAKLGRKLQRKSSNRATGIHRAVDRLAK